MEYGGVRCDRVGRVAYVDGRLVVLTEIEHGMLACLVEAGGEPVSAVQLTVAAWGRGCYVSPDALKQRVSCLRRKVGAARIRSVYGYGYMLVEP